MPSTRGGCFPSRPRPYENRRRETSEETLFPTHKGVHPLFDSLAGSGPRVLGMECKSDCPSPHPFQNSLLTSWRRPTRRYNCRRRHCMLNDHMSISRVDDRCMWWTRLCWCTEFFFDGLFWMLLSRRFKDKKTETRIEHGTYIFVWCDIHEVYVNMETEVDPFGNAVPFFGQTTYILSGLSPKRDCRPNSSLLGLQGGKMTKADR